MRLTLNLFGRQVCRGTLEQAGAGNLRYKPRDTEVAEFHFVIRGDEDVAGFDVAVNDPGAMGQRESPG